MHKLEYRKRTIGVTLFRWGFYFHLRWKLHWIHVKMGFWVQRGLRVSTRRQSKVGKKRRYVSAVRFNVSLWHTHNSKQGKPIVMGTMFYFGRTE